MIPEPTSRQQPNRMQSSATVFVVDDDEAVLDALGLLIRSVGLEVEAYPSADEFLAAYDPGRRGCLVLDIRMPRMSGLELQTHLNSRNASLPVIFITGHGDVPMAVRAMREGAFDFLLKPFHDQELLDRIHEALAVEDRSHQEHEFRRKAAQHIDSLTARETEVMELMVRGLTNKAIAGELSVSQRTVEVHRAHIMKKMAAGSLAQLVRMVLAVQKK